MAVPEESPSPMIPIIMLLLLGTMVTIPSMMTYDPKVYWASKIAQVQTHFVVGAFLIPVCLLLSVQAFGIPQVNPMETPNPSLPFVDSISHNMTTSAILVVIIIVLLMLIPLRTVLPGSWQPPPPYGRRIWW